MEIYPAVDLYEGNVVRLERGDYAKCKVYSTEPEKIARRWIQAGARWIHVVDLEGARSGAIRNWGALEKIVSLKASVQFGGGVRQKQDVERLIQMGVRRVILGTKILDKAFLSEITQSYDRRIALSLDLRGEEVQIEGWLKGAGRSIFDLYRELKNYPVDCLIITDIEKDGTLTGINQERISRVLEKAPFPVILSGGVASLDDIRNLVSLKSGRLKGVIVGKALYEDRLDLKTALSLAQEKGE